MSPSVSLGSCSGWPVVRSRTGMRCRMVIFSGPMRTSLTSSRRTRWRSGTSAPPALSRSWAKEPFEAVGEFEVGVAVGELGVQGVELAAQVGLAGAQVGHPAAQLVDGEQLFLERFDHAGDRGGGPGQGQFQAFALADGRVGGAGLGQPFADLGPDEGRVGEQAGDVVPDHGAGVVGADRLVRADPAALVPVVVGAEAPVVVDLLAGAGGRAGAVVPISAVCA